MKRDIIHIMEDGRIVIPAVHPDKIRMDEAELVSLFNVVAPTLRAAKRRIYKLEILQPFTAEQRIPQKRNLWQAYKNHKLIPIRNILMHIVITTNIHIIITFRQIT